MDGLSLKAKAKVTLTKLDEAGNVVEVKEQEIDLTEQEVEAIWHSQQQE